MSDQCAALCLYAKKGGNGRTLLTQQLAGAVAELNARVLVIDQDPQASISKNFFGPAEVERFPVHQTVTAIYQGQKYDPNAIIHQTPVENISLAPSNDSFEEFDVPRAHREDLIPCLRHFVAQVNRNFDIILIDTAPNVSNLPGWVSLAASDYVVTPLLPAKNSIEAVFDIKKRLQVSMTQDNPELVDLGYFLTNFDSREKINHAQLQMLKQLHGEQIFDTIVYRRKEFTEAPYSLMPVTHRSPQSEAADMVRALLREIWQRINNRFQKLEALAQEEHEQTRQANSAT